MKLEVQYHFFLTDDTTQDTEAVLCAKHFLYSVVLPAYGKKKVRFRSDGAGCYSSKEAKSAMIFFGELSKKSNAAYETSYKVSVAGCGKTALDVSQVILSVFLILNQKLTYHILSFVGYSGDVWGIDNALDPTC